MDLGVGDLALYCIAFGRITTITALRIGTCLI